MFEQIITQAALGVIGAALTWGAALLSRKTGVEIEQVYVERIKEAIGNIVAEALRDGKTDVAEIARLVMPYLLQTMPKTVAKVAPTETAVKTIVAKKLVELTVGAS